MTRAEIIYMARETDCLDDQHYGTVWVNKLERFAAMVAAYERDECAKVCDERAAAHPIGTDEQCEAEDCAKAIRARGEA